MIRGKKSRLVKLNVSRPAVYLVYSMRYVVSGFLNLKSLKRKRFLKLRLSPPTRMTRLLLKTRLTTTTTYLTRVTFSVRQPSNPWSPNRSPVILLLRTSRHSRNFHLQLKSRCLQTIKALLKVLFRKPTTLRSRKLLHPLKLQCQIYLQVPLHIRKTWA